MKLALQGACANVPAAARGSDTSGMQHEGNVLLDRMFPGSGERGVAVNRAAKLPVLDTKGVGDTLASTISLWLQAVMARDLSGWNL